VSLAASGLFAGGIGAVSAYMQSWIPLAAGGVALAAAAGVLAWRRRQSIEPASCGCSGSGRTAAPCGKGGS
jgi:LPXTG-motif cell wall-anchored protein